jgi:hypothetical protein
MTQTNETIYPKIIFYKGYEIVQLFKNTFTTKLKNHGQYSTGEQITITLLHMKEMINKDIKKGI